MIRPQIDNAPGLVLRPYKEGWEARWQCRTDLAKRGFTPNSQRLWTGDVMTDIDRAWIAERCNALQDEMLIWSRGGLPVLVEKFDGTIKALIAAYKNDVDSPYQKKRFSTREFYDNLCKRIEKDLGDRPLAEIKAREVLHWYDGIAGVGKVPMAHAVVGMLRTLCGFGMTMMEDDACARLSLHLSKMRFKGGKSRTVHLTAGQAKAIIQAAHENKQPSIALAQAIQFEAMLRQKDVIGEWVPMSELGPVTGVLDGNRKWWRGIKWDELDSNLVLHHVTSKRDKLVEPPLGEAPMVMEEFARIGTLPKSGPMIISEATGLPYYDQEFRRQWRILANKCGIPKDVRNMDSRSGAITEAVEADAPLESIKHAATHSDIGMTQRYSRNSQEKTADVMRARVAHRKNEAGK